MDPINIPNTSQYPVASTDSSDMSGGVSSVAMDPQAYAGATLNTDPTPKKKNTGVYIGILVAFIVMAGSAITFFIYLSGNNANASSNDDRYKTILSQTEAGKATPVPAPTLDMNSFAVTLTPSPVPKITVFPTLANRVATSTPTPEITITPMRGNKWAISFTKMSYTKSELPGTAPQAIGTLYTPVEYGKTFCTDSSNTFFTWKKNSSTIERLCDRLTPTTMVPQLTCYKSSSSGVAISATLLPTTDCYSRQEPPTGTYVMYTKVYYGCDESAAQQTAASCTSVKEIFSDDFNFTKN